LVQLFVAKLFGPVVQFWSLICDSFSLALSSLSAIGLSSSIAPRRVETYTIRDQGDVIVITKWAVLHTRQRENGSIGC
jgi:hypothetical protein